ncbi:MAG: hypothetical protein H8E59_06510 [Actinobacteria bacterium]|nr:hypothetical protein [Actinomycetota bacterium]
MKALNKAARKAWAFVRLVRNTKPAQDSSWRTSAERSAYKAAGSYPGHWKKPSRKGDKPWAAYNPKKGS